MLYTELLAIAVFLITYALIIDERIHRAVAAMAARQCVVFTQISPGRRSQRPGPRTIFPLRR